MCGIAGVAGGDPRERSRVVDSMLARLAHRGPDGRGAADGGAARLGCTRLAIRGGGAGAQPFRGRRGLLVYNGEVYNTGELRKDLAWHGVDVSGESDTEVVAALLDVYGIDAVERMNGMFALAWDDGSRVLLARDPAGVKPLYYRLGPESARFASEIAPLLDPRPPLHEPALARWLRFHVAHGEETFFAGVRRVPPGGIVELPSGRVARQAGAMSFAGAPNPALDAERLRRLLVRAVADAAAGERCAVALSGGLDSTLVAALLPGERVAVHGRVRAPGCDESGHARAAARELGLPLVEVDVTAEACLAALPRVVRALEEPTAGPGSLAQWLVAERAAGEARVLFSGCGGDELFGGYARAAAVCRDEPPPGLEAYAPLFARAAALPPERRPLALLDRGDRRVFRRERFRDEAVDLGPARTPAAAAARLEAFWTLPALLHVEDRVGMAHSLETRVPLLDRRLLRAAERLPDEARVDAEGRTKALFKDAAAPLLPAAVRGRRDKMGFPLPLGAWFAGPWADHALEVLTDPRTRERGIVDPDGALSALASPGAYDRGLCAALFLEHWCREFLDA